ncbi:hypothetical protein ABZ626_25240 [Streptomyces longispororuber]|uniref:hypothetical protein n=1 Tax=Streptomyces longispororuber TaxID=68230 RepID=UPI0033C105D0
MTRFGNKFRQRAGAVVALAAAASLAGSVPAHAEGSRTSYIKGWKFDQESSRWHDSHRDSNATKVQFKGCSSDQSSGFKANLSLYRAKSLAPDPSYGKKLNTCNTSNWGTMRTAGDYYFKYHGVGYVISVDKVKVSW